MHRLILWVLYVLTTSLGFLALLSYLYFLSQFFTFYIVNDNNIHLISLIIKKINKLTSTRNLIIPYLKWSHKWIRMVHWEQCSWGRNCFESCFNKVQPIMMEKVECNSVHHSWGNREGILALGWLSSPLFSPFLDTWVPNPLVGVIHTQDGLFTFD